MTKPVPQPFTSGELVLHHRYEQRGPITCGAVHGCVTQVVDEVQCPACLFALREEAANLGTEDPHGEAFDLFENLRGTR